MVLVKDMIIVGISMYISMDMLRQVGQFDTNAYCAGAITIGPIDIGSLINPSSTQLNTIKIEVHGGWWGSMWHLLGVSYKGPSVSLYSIINLRSDGSEYPTINPGTYMGYNGNQNWSDWGSALSYDLGITTKTNMPSTLAFTGSQGLDNNYIINTVTTGSVVTEQCPLWCVYPGIYEIDESLYIGIFDSTVNSADGIYLTNIQNQATGNNPYTSVSWSISASYNLGNSGSLGGSATFVPGQMATPHYNSQNWNQGNSFNNWRLFLESK